MPVRIMVPIAGPPVAPVKQRVRLVPSGHRIVSCKLHGFPKRIRSYMSA